MMKMYGATVPPSNGGGLSTRNSKTGKSNRYCIHYVSCSHYKRSRASNNTVGFETPSLEDMNAHLENLEEMPGGIRCCGTCLRK
jgi:hypothetical protein